MERLPICPNCLSRWPDIRGMIFAVGSTASTQCDHIWHHGAEYDPNRWVLSAFDEEFLAERKISLR